MRGGVGKASPRLTTMVSRLKLAFLMDQFLLNIIVNFEKYNLETSQTKCRKGCGLRGSGPCSKRIQSKLPCWVLRYGIMVKDVQGIPEFSN